jgi:hypothetical protein
MRRPAGWAVDTFGAHGGFAVAATATGVMAVLAVTGLRALRVPQQRENECLRSAQTD